MRDEYNISELNPRKNPYTNRLKKQITINIDGGTIDFAGQERSCISVVGTTNETDLYEKQVIIFSGNYLFIITAVSFLEDNCDTLLSNFTALAE